MTRFPYHFDRGGPTTREGIPVVYSRSLSFTAVTTVGFVGDQPIRNAHPTLMIMRSVEGRSVAYTNDPDFEWAFYLSECIDQARAIVRDGLRARLPWLRDETG